MERQDENVEKRPAEIDLERAIFEPHSSVRAHLIADSAEGIRYLHDRAAERDLDAGMYDELLSF